MDLDFLEQVLRQHTSAENTLHITDEEGRILVSSDPQRIGSQSRTALYVLQVGRPTVIDSHLDGEGSRSFCTPIFAAGQLQGSVVSRGPAHIASEVGNTVKYSIETALEYDLHKSRDEQGVHPRTSLAKLLLERESDTDKLNSMMNRLELDSSLMRCVIAIDLSFHQTKYFSINLNLGYQSTIEKMRSDLLEKIQANEFLNAEDLVIDHGGLLLIIKSFIPVGDLSRIYLSLDVICQSLVTTLEQESAIDFNIAYGNLYSGVSSIYKSLQEAKDTLHIGKLSQSQAKFNNLESVLFETICLHLQPQFINKLLEPALKLLQKDALRDYQQLLECAETYVDTSSNIAQTARLLRVHRNTVTTRLQRFHQITKFDSSQSFSNAFLIKLLAVYQRLTDASPQIEEALPYFRQP